MCLMDLEVSQTFRYRIFLCICFSPKFQDYKLFHQWLKRKVCSSQCCQPCRLKEIRHKELPQVS